MFCSDWWQVSCCIAAAILGLKAGNLSHQLKQTEGQLALLTLETEKLKGENDALQKKYNETQKAEKAQPAAKQSEAGKAAQKVAYLTFDDGPSPYTETLLNILKEHDVRATFFVVGNNVVKYQGVVQKAYENGNAVGIHCYNHAYSSIYASQTAFFRDYNNMKELLTSLLGSSPTLCRFPGGTSNTVSEHYGGAHFMQNILPQVTQMGMTPFDWNVDSKDAKPSPASVQAVVRNVVNQARKYHHPVILCHDTKKNTISAIPFIITELKNLGYSFDVLSQNAPACRQNPA